jgi:hypothetical protein
MLLQKEADNEWQTLNNGVIISFHNNAAFAVVSTYPVTLSLCLCGLVGFFPLFTLKPFSMWPVFQFEALSSTPSFLNVARRCNTA